MRERGREGERERKGGRGETAYQQLQLTGTWRPQRGTTTCPPDHFHFRAGRNSVNRWRVRPKKSERLEPPVRPHWARLSPPLSLSVSVSLSVSLLSAFSQSAVSEPAAVEDRMEREQSVRCGANQRRRKLRERWEKRWRAAGRDRGKKKRRCGLPTRQFRRGESARRLQRGGRWSLRCR